MKTIRVMPIEGKDYRSVQEVKRGLVLGDDFIINDGFHDKDGTYTSLAAMGEYSHVEVRYREARESVVFSVLELEEEAL